MLTTAARNGTWLCLKVRRHCLFASACCSKVSNVLFLNMQNLHLVTHWLGTMEKLLKSLTPHPKFRLWLTTEVNLYLDAQA